MPRFSARARLSETLPALEYAEGMVTPTTRSGPSASAAMDAVSAESMPPLNPSRTRSNRFLRA